MFNYDSFSESLLRTNPFKWAHLRDVLPSAVALELAREFPSDSLSLSESAHSHYMLWDRTVIDAGSLICEGPPLPRVWDELLREILSDTYRDAVESLTGTSVRGCALKVRLCRYAAGCWMLPHTDKQDRVVTQVLYLTPGWDGGWGGRLQILNSDEASDVACEVAPEFNTSVVFVRADNSFHAVAPVGDGIDRDRLSLLIQYISVPAA